MADCGGGLVLAPPPGPGPDEGGMSAWWQQQLGDQRAGLRRGQELGERDRHAACRVFGTVLSARALPKASRRCVAARWARKA